MRLPRRPHAHTRSMRMHMRGQMCMRMDMGIMYA